MRKIKLLFISLLLALPVPAMAQSTLMGDVNGDGVVNVTDLNAIISIILDDKDWTDAADVNGDGNVNISDINAIISIIIDGPAIQEEDEYVDLGLPSGTLWATRNVGASHSYECGDKFAWGEIEPKDDYSWSTYKWCNGTDSTLTKYNTKSELGTVDGKTELEPEDDAAYVNWGPEWRMPSLDQMNELVDLCSWRYAQRNGMDGTLYTGPNGNTIFVYDYDLWSRTSVYLMRVSIVPTTADRYIGRSVRPVRQSPVSRPAVYIEQQSIELGCVTIGKTCKGQMTIVNNTPDPITLTATTEAPFSLKQDEDFVVSTTAVVPGNSHSTVTVMFTTTTPGEYSGNVTFQHTALDGGQTVVPVHAYALSEVVPQEDYVDLGLPSGTLWATCNVGASSPEEKGDYFAWGETEPKDEYSWSTYKWRDGSALTKYCLESRLGTVDGKTELEPEDDAAYVNWGPEWRMPSQEQLRELSRYCIWRRTQMNGENGCLLIGPNGNTLFLNSRVVHYWSSSLNRSYSNEAYILSEDSQIYFTGRYYGNAVRAVREPISITPQSIDMEEVCIGDTDSAELTIVNNSRYPIKLTATIDEPFKFMQDDGGVSSMTIEVPGDTSLTVTVMFSPTTQGDYRGNVTFQNSTADWYKKVIPVHACAIPEPIPWEEYVDLGLPSGTLWATMNIGANRIEKYGDYFAWGETEPKADYSWSTYKWRIDSVDVLTKYCTDSNRGAVDGKIQLEPEDDAAYVNWGAAWRMPTLEQQKELIDNCTWKWTTKKGVKGYLVTGPNKQTLFLPAAGYHCDNESSPYLTGVYGDYWSRTLSADYPDFARDQFFYPQGLYYGTSSRNLGFTVRAVRAEPDVYITPRSLDLGEVPVGETREGELTIVNNTTESVILTATVQEPFSFKQEGGNASTMTIEVPVGSCKLSVMYTAAAPVTHIERRVTFQGSALEGGQCVIPVQAVVIYTSDYVDLGLPSGTLWATRNIGANNPEDYGDYFAWGETSPKESYSWETYKWSNGNDSTLTKYCSNIEYGTVDNKIELEPEDDAAYVNWGPEWRIPTFEQQMELFDKCEWKPTAKNGVDGVLITGPNGNSIFLPAAGFCDNVLDQVGSRGRFWSRSLREFNSFYLSVNCLDFWLGMAWGRGANMGSRYEGFSVRPVRVSQQ